MLSVYTYVIDHDLGLAPNPFWGYCTLAVCKPKIRKSKSLKTGDWIVGTGSVALEKRLKRPPGQYINKIIYAMEVTEILTFEEYWNDPRFFVKRPNVNGSLARKYGDNIYYPINDDWGQLDSAHSNSDGSMNLKHRKKDLSGKNVLISNNFYYFGDNLIKVPNKFVELFKYGVGEKKNQDALAIDLINWIKETQIKDITGDPIDWITHVQTSLF